MAWFVQELLPVRVSDQIQTIDYTNVWSRFGLSRLVHSKTWTGAYLNPMFKTHEKVGEEHFKIHQIQLCVPNSLTQLSRLRKATKYSTQKLQQSPKQITSYEISKMLKSYCVGVYYGKAWLYQQQQKTVIKKH